MLKNDTTMTVFRENNNDIQRLDFCILRDSVVSLYWKKDVLESDLDWFKNENYEIISFDCKTWTDEIEMHKQLKQNLYFPDYYGMNLNALNDCLSDFEIIKTGQIIVFEHLDSIDSRLLHDLLDVFAINSRQQLLFGKRLIILAQVDDPNIEIDPVGAFSVSWNGQEWLNSKRQIK
jgi:RNAse (barnase) inhibitor barstar